MKQIAILLLLLLATLTLVAQQEAVYTHYMYNTLAVNPAYAGSRDAVTITALHRSQWVGFEGAPRTQSLTVHLPMLKENIGFGVSLVQDNIGPVQSTNFSADYSFRIKLSRKGTLSLGLKTAMQHTALDNTKLYPTDTFDPKLIQATERNTVLNFGFGVHYSTERYYVGVSVPKLIENNLAAWGQTDFGAQKRQLFAIAGAVLDLTNTVKLKPTTALRLSKGVPVGIDLSAEFIYADKLWLGPSFRSGDAVGALAGVFVSPKLSVGYSYDFSYANHSLRHNSGSHEVMVRYDFGGKRRAQITSPRYF